jgi:hypothetical protein
MIDMLFRETPLSSKEGKERIKAHAIPSPNLLPVGVGDNPPLFDRYDWI